MTDTPNPVDVEAQRAQIRGSGVLAALIAHVEGRQEMASSQVTAAIALLKKALPDLPAGADAAAPEAPTELRIVLGGEE